MWRTRPLLLVLIAMDIASFIVCGKQYASPKTSFDDENGDADSADGDLTNDMSIEHIGAVVTQISRHPYAAALLKNGKQECSAVILNKYWLVTDSKCFDSNMVSSYVAHRNLKNFTVRVGSSYNNKGGKIYQIRTLLNNFDVKVSALKLMAPLEFGAEVKAARLPTIDEEVAIGYLASAIAWAPNAHIRLVNMPVIDASICESFTKLPSGFYICVGGVADGKRHFCRKDSGGAIIQNNTLIAITSYIRTCADYTRAHVFPKVSSFTRWIDAVIWDEETRPSTISQEPTVHVTTKEIAATETLADVKSDEPNTFKVSLPFYPINVPLEPGQDNSVIPRVSMYESYLHNMAKAKIMPQDPNMTDKEWEYPKKETNPKKRDMYQKSRYQSYGGGYK